MKLPRLPVGLEKLLASGEIITKYPSLAIISAYISYENHAFSVGLMNLVKFRLLHPFTRVLFFSFQSKEAIQVLDNFGVLDLDGTDYLQLPCTYDKLLKLAEKCNNKLNYQPKGWIKFSENACKTLLTNIIRELKHGGRFDIGNKILNSLQSSALAVCTMPELGERYQVIFEKNYLELNSFLDITEIIEFLQCANTCSESKNPFLKEAFLFSQQLTVLANNPDYAEPKKIISQIDQITSSLNILIHSYDGGKRT